jgi:pimeloyl-ACP methyl ester carboxylesterase
MLGRRRAIEAAPAPALAAPTTPTSDEPRAVLDAQPYVDRSKLLLVGVSVGGFATLALTAYPPPDLSAAIVFAPGEGSPAPDHVCAEDRLVEAMGRFGRTSRAPVLWISAANDHYFGPALTGRMVQAFRAGGGNVSYIPTGPFGADGHELFTRPGIDTWLPLADRFLRDHGLVLRDQPIENVHPELAPPPELAPADAHIFLDYLAAGPHKAFAVTSKGVSGWWSGELTTDAARAKAVEDCRQYAPTGDCHVVYVDNAPGN